MTKHNKHHMSRYLRSTKKKYVTRKKEREQHVNSEFSIISDVLLVKAGDCTTKTAILASDHQLLSLGSGRSGTGKVAGTVL
jgi:hypothetical protein